MLGPVINIFMARLHAYLRQCDDADHKVLFALRAGVRIKDLYETWLSARNAYQPTNLFLLRASRMMAIKAAYHAAPTLAVTALGRELQGASLNDIISCLLHQDVISGRCPEPPKVQQMPLHDFIKSEDQAAKLVRRYLSRQSDLYASYLNRLADNAERLILVDSGWRGTTQFLLEQAFPNYEWEGLYFGCIGGIEILGRGTGPKHGLMFDSDIYQPDKPETAFVIHRHLIESLFEPGIASIEHIEPGDTERKLGTADLVKNELRENWDDAYDGVRAYLNTHASDPLSKATSDYQVAMERLAELLCYPTKNDIQNACGKMRSHDLGRYGATSSVMPARDRFVGDSSELRIEQAIWKTGQAALEYSAERAGAAQKKIVSSLMGSTAEQYFTAPTDDTAAEAAAGRIAIITRTKDRPLLLRRAAESVACQTYDNYSWVIVNDGGSLEDVQQVLDDAAVDPTKITICSNSKSLGMEAASNVGIRACESEYVVIHDDDDSWHPDFLKETVTFLRQNRKVYSGVITKTLHVSEEILGHSVIEHGRRPYMDWVQNVQISEMVIGNFFPPIAFVFRRDVWEQLKGFDENLPVLGDWDFNLRFLTKANIGVLPKALAYYHHRDRGNGGGNYSNSVIGGLSRHAAYNAIVRNKYIRLAGTESEYAALAVLMGTAYSHEDTRHRLNNVKDQVIATNGQPAPTKITDIEALRREIAEAKNAAAQLQEELDRRWIMLHMAASVITKAKKLDVKAPELFSQFSEHLDEYINSTPLNPPPDFNDDNYMKRNSDVAAAASHGQVKSGFDHYIKFGKNEGRPRNG
ncbi:glycosyltransferase family 2 protein [Lacimonas salitolerans]|uniref:Glycosyltransferase family 2 protein n=1 Tax=Lacimonas salitolerans TaxID=1323750 RepID=A0ABW4EIN0_9RHOB